MAQNANTPNSPNAGEKSAPHAKPSLREFRFRAIWPLLKWHLATASEKEPLVIVLDGGEIRNLTQLVEYVASRQRPPVSSQTIWRWWRRLREGGIAALEDKPRSDRGCSRTFLKHRDAAIFVVAAMYEGWRPAKICREVQKSWPQLSGDGSAAPSAPILKVRLK